MFITTEMTNKEYLLQIAKQRQCLSFIIRNSTGDVVHIADTPMNFQDRYNELEMFMNNNSGVYKVELRTEAGRGLYPTRIKDKGSLIIGEYTVNLERESKPDKGINGFDFMAGINGFEIMRSYEGEKQSLKDEISTLRMENMLLKRDLDQMKGDFERKLTDAKSTDNRIMGILGKLGDVISPMPGAGPINGIQSTEKETMSDTTKKSRLINAINELTAVDPDFTENMEGLAKLAKNNPAMYKQAVSMLKNFA